MARPLRIEFPGALYHVIVRGNERAAGVRSLLYTTLKVATLSDVSTNPTSGEGDTNRVGIGVNRAPVYIGAWSALFRKST